MTINEAIELLRCMTPQSAELTEALNVVLLDVEKRAPKVIEMAPRAAVKEKPKRKKSA